MSEEKNIETCQIVGRSPQIGPSRLFHIVTSYSINYKKYIKEIMPFLFCVKMSKGKLSMLYEEILYLISQYLKPIKSPYYLEYERYLKAA